jgi:isopentenyldiphosphate isomerase
MSSPEILDLVNDNDEVIVTLSRDEIYSNNLKFVRVVNVFIKNDKGELWIPTRAAHKQIAPNGYDVGVGGHVEHGESYLVAFAKEVKEEAGWDVKTLKYREIGKYGPREGLSCVSMIYEINSNVEPELNPEDFSQAGWMTPVDLTESIQDGHLAKSDLLPLLRITYNV